MGMHEFISFDRSLKLHRTPCVFLHTLQTSSYIAKNQVGKESHYHSREFVIF